MSESASPPYAKALTPASSQKRRFTTVRVIVALMLREISTQYGRTPGGFIWTIIQPLGMIMFLSLGFQLMLRQPALGTSFLLFYASGYLFFSLFNRLSNAVSRSIKFSSALLKFPVVTWVDSLFARFFVNALMGILTGILLLTWILLTVESQGPIDFAPVAVAIGLSLLLGLAVGTFNCALMGVFPIWAVVWDILTRPLMIASGVLYLYEGLPDIAQKVLWYNPLIHITALARTAFYSTYPAAFVNIWYVVYVSLVVLLVGLILMRKYALVILNN